MRYGFTFGGTDRHAHRSALYVNHVSQTKYSCVQRVLYVNHNDIQNYETICPMQSAVLCIGYGIIYLMYYGIICLMYYGIICLMYYGIICLVYYNIICLMYWLRYHLNT